MAAYWPVRSAPFIFDDLPSIVENAGIRDLSRIGDVLRPPSSGNSVSGRPVVNLSLAINHAAGGLAVEGYHAFNLTLHWGAAALMFFFVRETLRQRTKKPSAPAEGTEKRSDWMAALVTFAWALHPLQTESVSCVIQRTELLGGFFYLGALAAFARSLREGAGRGWVVLAVVSCWLGMASKEVAVSAPLLVLLYDRSFAAGTFREALRKRWRSHLSIASGWLPLAWLVLASGGTRGETAGFGLGVEWWAYLLKQCEAIVLYLRLALWPHPLVLDYGIAVIRDWREVWAQGLFLVAVAGAAAWAVFRRPALGFCGVLFFALLAPSSSVVPVLTQTASEHRMYLPLAAILVPAVWCLGLAGRVALAAGWVGVAALGAATYTRNLDYESAVTIWSDTAAKVPANERAHLNLGLAWQDKGETVKAEAAFRAALARRENYPLAHFNLGKLLWDTGRRTEAEINLRRAAELNPRSAPSLNLYGRALAARGQMQSAAVFFAKAWEIEPENESAAFNLGLALLRLGRASEAVAPLRAATRLDEKNFKYRMQLARAFAAGRDWSEVKRELAYAELLLPRGDAELGLALGQAWLEAGDASRALLVLEAVAGSAPESEIVRVKQLLRVAQRRALEQ